MKCTLVLLVALALGGCAHSARVNFMPLPDSAATDFPAVDWESLQAQYPGTDGVYLFKEELLEHSGGKGPMETWQLHRIQRVRRVVFNSESDWLTTFSPTRYPSKVYLTVRTPEGEVRRYGVEDLEIDNKGHIAFAYPDIRPGSVIDEAAEFSYIGGPIDYEVPLEFVIPCERLTFKFAYPDWWELRFKRFPDGSQPALVETRDSLNRKITFLYQDSLREAVRLEPYSPSYSNLARTLTFQVSKLQMGEQYSFQASETWADLAKSLETRHRRSLRQTSPGTKRRLAAAMAAHLPGTAAGPMDSVRSLLAFFQRDMEVVEFTGAENMYSNYEEVLRDQKGDPFNLAATFDFALEYFGYASHMLVAHSSEDGYFDSMYVNVRQLSTPLVRWTLGEEEHVLCPYDATLPFGSLPYQVLGQPALILDHDVVEHLFTLPATDTAVSRNEINFRVTMEPDGSLQITERRGFVGGFATGARELMKGMSQEDLKDMVAAVSACAEGPVPLDSFEVEHLDQQELPVELVLFYRLPGQVSLLPGEAVLRTAWLESPMAIEKSSLQRPRRYPVEVEFAQDHHWTVEVPLPAGWTIQEIPGGQRDSTVFGIREVQCRAEDGVLTWESSLRLNRVQQPASESDQLWKLIGVEGDSAPAPIRFSRPLTD